MTRIEFGSKLEEARKHNDFISMHNLCKEYYKAEGKDCEKCVSRIEIVKEQARADLLDELREKVIKLNTIGESRISNGSVSTEAVLKMISDSDYMAEGSDE